MFNVPIWFITFLIMFCLLIITGTIRIFSKNKIINSIEKMTDEKREQLINSYSGILKIYKIFFWSAPLYLICIPFIIYKYASSNFIYILILMIILSITILEDYLFRKSIINTVS